MLQHCRREVGLKGQVYFCADQGYQDQQKAALAKSRKRSPQLEWSKLLTVGEALRLREHRDKAMQFHNPQDMITLVDQNLGFESMMKLLPCLTKTSVAWSFQLERPLLAMEGLIVLGFPATDDLVEVCGVQMPFKFYRVKIQNLRYLIGNGQSCVVMGWAGLWCLGATVEREHPTVMASISSGADLGEQQDDDADQHDLE